MRVAIRKFLEQIDIFGQTITLNMNKNAYYTTQFGGVASIAIIVLLCLICFSNVASFVEKENVSYDIETSFSDDPNLIEMNDENMMFAISIEQTNFTTNPYFNITVEQRIYTRYINGSLSKTINNVPLTPCTIDRFNNITIPQGLNISDQYNYLGIDHWLCPKHDYSFQLQGTYSSETFKFIKIYVSTCQNNSNQEEWSPTCSTEEEINEHLLDEGQFKLQIFQLNTIINPQQTTNYATMFIDSEMYFTFVPLKLSRQANIYYRPYVIKNDESLLPYEDIQQETIITRQQQDYRDLTELGRDTDDQYAIVYLRRSPFTQFVTRKYQKITELLSYLGGFMQIMRVIFGFFIAFYNRTAMLLELSNKLYDFKQVDNVTLNQTIKYYERSPKPDLNENQQGDPINSDNQIEWKNMVTKLLQRTKPLRFNLKIFLNQLSCGYFFKNNNSKFFEKAIQQINNELDLHSILYQLHEIDKLKTVLLRHSQVTLFNFSPKPIITLSSDTSVPSRLLIQIIQEQSRYVKGKQNEVNEDLCTKLQDAYKEIMDEIDKVSCEPCQMKVNLKLTQMLGADLNQMIKNNTKPESIKLVDHSNIIHQQEEDT